MRMKNRKRSYALPVMGLILIGAGVLTACGILLRHTLLAGLPQYENVPYLSVPMMLIQDSGPLREARERAAWEAEQAALATAETPEPTPTPTPEPTPETPDEGTLVVIPPETAAPTPGPTSEPTPEPTPEPAPEPTPEPEPAPESYFDHTLFIGDSKTDEMRNAVRIGQAQYFCDTNFSVYNVFEKTASDALFTNASLDWVLRRFSFDQIYIILGYNESGYPYGGLMDQFDYVIRRVHEAQPNARIILHAVMHASERVSGSYSDYSVANLERVNEGIRALAESYDYTYFVDCNEPFCDENGYLLSYVSADGEHLLPDYSRQWAEEIRRRAVIVN